MAKKRTAARPRGGGAATNKPAAVSTDEKVIPATKQVTPVKEVKLKESKIDPRPKRKGDTFLFIKDGNDVYLTRAVANVLFQRNTSSVVIPKGSEYIPPKGSKCDGCG